MEIIRLQAMDGRQLGFACWQDPASRDFLVYIPGLINSYAYFAAAAERLWSGGLNVVVLERRRLGLNEEVAGSYRKSLADIDAVVAWIRARRPDARIHLGAISGGTILAATYALDRKSGLASVFFASPEFYPRFGVFFSRIHHFLSRLLFPAWTRSRVGYLAEIMSRDPGLVEMMRRHPLKRKWTLIPHYIGSFFMNLGLKSGKRLITIPALILLGGADRMIVPEKNLKLLERICVGERKIIVYPGALHLLYLEEKAGFARDILEWVHAAPGEDSLRSGQREPVGV